MLDVSTPSPTREATQVTALVTRAGTADLEVRVWPPEHVWDVARHLDEAGHTWEGALPDESGLPSSLLLRRRDGFTDDELGHLLDDLHRLGEGTAVLGYLGAEDDGACAPVPGPHPLDRDHVVFVELHQLQHAGRWQLRAFGSAGALARLRAAARGLALVTDRCGGDQHSAVLELPDRPAAVDDLVARLDRAGLDGHVRVLRQHAG